MVRDSTIMFATFGFLIGAFIITDIELFDDMLMFVAIVTTIGFLIAGFTMRHGEE